MCFEASKTPLNYNALESIKVQISIVKAGAVGPSKYVGCVFTHRASV